MRSGEFGILVLGIVLGLAHFAVVGYFYPALPAEIPAFANGAGLMPKTPLAACRLALMGLAAQTACWAMFRTRPWLWGAVAIVIAGKMMLETLSLAGYASRPAVYALSLLGVALLVPFARKGTKTAAPVPWGILGAAGVAYVGLVLMPYWP